uniref:Uncharacterized protein n=1 Tax=Trichuris muris TaxID=70415 RepID=A0A5S6QIX7_TRIMR
MPKAARVHEQLTVLNRSPSGFGWCWVSNMMGRSNKSEDVSRMMKKICSASFERSYSCLQAITHLIFVQKLRNLSQT